jgi:hypothetical protein
MIVKCQRCELKDTHREEMDFDIVGKQKKYYHKNCFQEHLEEKAFKEHERVELDKLVEVIKKIYGVKTIPNPAYPYLQDLRNGNKFFGKYDYKYKQGYTYDLIAETFDYCSDTIEYWNSRKSFNGFTNALRYGLAIVCDKLSVVEERRKQREKQKREMERHIENIDGEEQIFETNYKKPAKHTDITDFLDD